MVICFGFGGTAQANILQQLEFKGRTHYLLAAKWWEASEAEATSLGGHLATVNSAAQHDFIYDNFWPHCFGQCTHSVWIGLSDPLMDENLVWCDQAAVDYLDFFPDQPQRNHDVEMFMGIRIIGPQ